VNVHVIRINKLLNHRSTLVAAEGLTTALVALIEKSGDFY